MKAKRFANLILGGGAILCTVLLGYVIMIYDVLRIQGFSGRAGMILYHLMPAMAAVLLFASLRMEPSHKVNLSLLLFSSGLTLYAMDLFLFVNHPISLREAAAKKAGADYDDRSKLEYVRALRKEGVDAYPNITSTMLLPKQGLKRLESVLTLDGAEVLPLAGIANKVIVFSNESGAWLTYVSDEHGFHNPKGTWSRAPMEIAVVGDSYAQGYSTPSGTNFADLIRKRYPATLNLGLAGNGPLLDLAALKEYLPLLKPRIVLWCFFEGNDLCEMRVEKTSPLLMHYLEHGFLQDLSAKEDTITRLLAAYVNARMPVVGKLKGAGHDLVGVLTGRHIREHLGLIYGESVWPVESYGCVYVKESDGFYLDEFRTEDDLLFHQILSQAQETVSSWGGRLYFVYLPEWQRYHNPALANKDRDRVLELVRNAGIPVIDIHPAFQAQEDPLSLFPLHLRGHYNTEGHRVVAEAVLNSISLYE